SKTNTLQKYQQMGTLHGKGVLDCPGGCEKRRGYEAVCCHRSRVPVLAIAAQIPSPEIGAGFFQETHPQTLFKECSHYCELVSEAQQMPRVLQIAIREAVGKRGVSVVVLPGDVALESASDAPLAKRYGLLPPRPTVTPADADLQRLAALLN